MISVRRAELADASAIGAVHVAAWRSTYPGILPDAYLAKLSPTRLALQYRAAIGAGATVMVATARGEGPRIVGFATAGTARTPGLGDGEIETLYVLDDFRDQGVGRRILRAAAAQLAARGCASVFVWVLRQNPSRWFYRHLGGQQAAEGQTRLAGVALEQVAYSWDPIDSLLMEAKRPSKGPSQI
jgi:ribosomal protein S18 acetylase RimI-like enzyme